MSNFQIIFSIMGLLLGGGVATSSVWWVVKSIFDIRARLVKMETQNVERARRCAEHSQSLKIGQETMIRMDKNITKIAAKLDVEITD